MKDEKYYLDQTPFELALKLIEYMDIDPEDTDDTYLLGISLGFIRICFVW